MTVESIQAWPAGESVSLPYFDTAVNAGEPGYVSQPLEGQIDIGRELVNKNHATFCVRVNGQSMVDAGIDSGDLLIVDKDLPADNGSIILAVIDGEFTVKRLVKNGPQVYLQPENASFSPIHIEELNDFRVWGVVTGVIKKV